jgi:hypothetical protein
VAPDTMQHPKPPEWWTEENTEAWHREVWGGDREQSAAQVEWSAPYDGVRHVARPRTSPSTWTIPAKVMAEWRKDDPRPSPTHYFDGTPIDYAAARAYSEAVQRSKPKPKRGRKLVAA